MQQKLDIPEQKYITKQLVINSFKEATETLIKGLLDGKINGMAFNNKKIRTLASGTVTTLL